MRGGEDVHIYIARFAVGDTLEEHEREEQAMSVRENGKRKLVRTIEPTERISSYSLCWGNAETHWLYGRAMMRPEGRRI